jgi:hypothetical protein
MRADRRRWTRGVALPVLVLALTATGGCGTEEERPGMTSNGEAAAMETVLEDYTAMRRDMVAALDEELGPKPWDVSSTNPKPVRSGCRSGEDPDGERVAMASWSFRGTYDAADWKRSAQVVQRVGREHGFTRTGTTVEAPDDLQVFGEDARGGRYVYGLSVNTVLGISTGCHVWRSPPTAASPQPTIPGYDSSDG